jgi:hypothetical protein
MEARSFPLGQPAAAEDHGTWPLAVPPGNERGAADASPLPGVAEAVLNPLHMSDLAAVIEALEHRWMRAWIAGDVPTLRLLTARKFRMVFATKPCVILDAPSWLKGAADRFQCEAYRFGDTYVSRSGPVAVFATQLQIVASVRGADLSGELWVTSLWSKAGLRRRWQMSQRVVSRVHEDVEVSRAIASLQLWR